METMSYEEQEAARAVRLAEVGTEPPCPFCGKARVKRSDYTRCLTCGKNWLAGEDLTKDPRLSRTRGTGQAPTETSGGARIAESTTDDEG